MLKITLTTIASCGRVGLLSLTSMTVMINSNDFVFVLTFLLIYVLIRSKNNWEKTVNKQCNLKFCLSDHPGRTELQTSDSNYWRINLIYMANASHKYKYKHQSQTMDCIPIPLIRIESQIDHSIYHSIYIQTPFKDSAWIDLLPT